MLKTVDWNIPRPMKCVSLGQGINLNLENHDGDVDHDCLLGERITSAIGYKVIKFIQFLWEI
jgi:hypothetical protein